MARAPLSREQLLERAEFVYVGRVAEVRDGEADIDVEQVEQALFAGDDGPRTVTVHFRDEPAGPDAPPGDYGQHSPLRQGARVRTFVAYDAENRAQLLEPNGWEPAE